ncbi:unnamed protein product [Porites evermanni]|uniref:Uncharacterized protein n=1 Tax=Porites evermanni TaxID=104178 RepID=A0ABN8MI04_9CNID|nr:unnamed protein product [Porites evermanni]
MEPRTQQNIYKEGNPRDMEKNEGIMSVFNRYSLRTTFAIAQNAKESKFPLMSHSWFRNCISILNYPVDLSTVKCVIMFYQCKNFIYNYLSFFLGVYTSTPLKRTATTTADIPKKQSPIAIQEARY